MTGKYRQMLGKEGVSGGSRVGNSTLRTVGSPWWFWTIWRGSEQVSEEAVLCTQHGEVSIRTRGTMRMEEKQVVNDAMEAKSGDSEPKWMR